MSDYNGWKNRETWLVGLWLSNEYFTNKKLEYICNTSHVDMDNHERSEWLKEWFFETYEIDSKQPQDSRGTNVWRGIKDDLAEGESLENVDWRELVEGNQYDA